jgi:diacylglycerol kinase (ATP)
VTRAFTALVNPVAGDGVAASRWDAVAAHLPDGVDVEVVRTLHAGHAVEAARHAAVAGRVVVSVGGDGLARDIATGVVAGAGVMAIVPAGRGNDFAQRVGLPDSPEALAAVLLDGVEHPYDVIDAGGVMVPGNVYAGIDSVSSVIINRSRWLPARFIYRLSPYLALARWRIPEFRITVDGVETVTRGHIVVIGNSGRYGHGLSIVPSAEPDDGRLDVLVVRDVSRLRLSAFMRDAQAGTHADWDEAEVLTGASVTLAANRRVPVCADGDELAELGGEPVSVQVRPGALRLLVAAR